MLEVRKAIHVDSRVLFSKDISSIKLDLPSRSYLLDDAFVTLTERSSATRA
jgi:hypothetical protein